MQNRTFVLSDRDRDHLRSCLKKVTYDPHGGTAYLVALRKAGMSGLPFPIVEALTEQRASLQPRPYLIIDNLPIDDWETTSFEAALSRCRKKRGDLSENVAMMFAAMIGEPYSIAFEGDEVVNNLIPEPESAKAYTGLGFEVELDFHIENAALKFLGEENFSPMGLLLTGVRHDPGGPATRVCDARDALNALAPEDVTYLRRHMYRIKVPFRWRKPANELDSARTLPVPMVRGDERFPDVSAVFYADMVEALSEPAKTALENFHVAVRACAVEVDVIPGRLLYIDNRISLHARDRFTPTLDEHGRPLRWIQRVFVAPNLWNHRHLVRSKDRVFDAQVAESC